MAGRDYVPESVKVNPLFCFCKHVYVIYIVITTRVGKWVGMMCSG